MGLKPLLVGEYSTNSKLTRSDVMEPFFSAAVPGWSPSKVRSRIVTSVLLRLVDIDEAGLLERLAHIVHVEAEHACGQLLALALLVGVAFFSPHHDVRGIAAADDHDAVIVGDHGIAGDHVNAGADHGNVDGAERCLDGALGGNRLRPHRKAPLAMRLCIAAAGVDNKPYY